MERRPQSAGDQPRSEPEIIPPERAGGRPQWKGGTEDVQRIYVARVGPFGFVLLALTIAILTAVVFVILLGAFVIAIPLAVLLLALALVGSVMRRRFRGP
jgi:uncharacterized integral membrane protein